MSQIQLEQILRQQLAKDKKQNLQRQLRTFTANITLFSENDYLGLATQLSQLEIENTSSRHSMYGAGAARLLSGNSNYHNELEQKIASFKNTQSALTFSSGYAAACGIVPALVSRGDYIILDKSIHACFLDASRISEATTRVFAHNDLNQLKDLLKHIRENHPAARILIAVESLYSMDGDFAPLQELVTIKNRYGAWLLVDEAHATGLYGKHLRGKCEEANIAEEVDIQMGTLGKAIGSMGGYVAGSKTLIDFLIQHARTFMFTTAPPPIIALVSSMALDILTSEEGERLRSKLMQNISLLTNALSVPKAASPIQCIPVGEEALALEISNKLLQKSFYVPSIRYPTVPRGLARLRVSVTAKHNSDQIATLSQKLKDLI